MRALVALSALLLGTAVCSAARAQDTQDKLPPLQVPTSHDDYWSRGNARPFAAVTVDAGYLYLRPKIAVGYGKPFKVWAGVEAYPFATSTDYGGYGGVRFQIPWFELHAGARVVYAFQHELLVPRPSYDTIDLQDTTGIASHYVTLYAELSGGIPAGPGSILLLATAASVQGVPSGYNVYEENLRVITSPPAIYRVRAGYALRVGPEGAGRVGLVAEALDMPDRSVVMWRAGVVGSFAIDDHLEAVGLLVVPVYGPDSLGIAGGDFAELGLRYRWATGEGSPSR